MSVSGVMLMSAKMPPPDLVLVARRSARPAPWSALPGAARRRRGGPARSRGSDLLHDLEVLLGRGA